MMREIRFMVARRFASGAVGAAKAAAKVSFWPKAAVQLSIAGRERGKIADCHEGLEPTQRRPWTELLYSAF